MPELLKLAARNLLRYRRRTALTALLITLGIVAVLLFLALSGSFKTMMVGQITDSMLGHLQVHRKGYVASIDNLPLNMMMGPKAAAKAAEQLQAMEGVEAWSPRIKFGAMFSNFNETTNIRLNAVYPQREQATCPQLAGRVIEGDVSEELLKPGALLIPELVAKGMKVKLGDTVVLVATNPDGAVNGQSFTVRGILEGISGPGGRDGYMHIDDARALLRLEDGGLSEIAVRLKDPEALPKRMAQLQSTLGQMRNQQGKPTFEIHDWQRLTPFSSIARMIDLLTLFIQIMLLAIVLISITNVMIMAVYERMREIGTLAAIGTPPGRILGLFVLEGGLLGLMGSLLGILLSLGVVGLLHLHPVHFDFGRQQDLLLTPVIGPADVALTAMLVVLVAVIASLQPAWKASRMDPITALHSV